ncbi:MAG: hypothetical protein AAF656_05090 [Planctomycetota bacterium]
MLTALTGVVHAAEPTVTDARDSYEWGLLPMGGGGYFLNVLPHPTRPGELYINSDMTGPFVRRSPEERFVNRSLFNRALDDPATMVDGPSEMALHPDRPDRLFVSVRGAGLVRSEDAAETFEQVHDVSSFTKHTGPTLAIAPGDPDLIFRGTDDDGLFRSTQGGDAGTWEKLTVDPDADEKAQYLMIYGKGDDAPLYVHVGGRGLFKSTDAGETFMKVAEDGGDDAATEIGEVELLSGAFDNMGKEGLPDRWSPQAEWMRGAIFRRVDEDGVAYVEVNKRHAFALRTIDVPDNVVELTVTADARSPDLEPGGKPHETVGVQFLFEDADGKRKGVNWQKSIFLKPGLEDWTEQTTTFEVPADAAKLVLRVGNDAASGGADLKNLVVTGTTGEPRGAVGLNPLDAHQLAAGPDGTIYLSGNALRAYHPDRGWRDITPDAPGDGKVRAVAADPHAPGKLIVSAGRMPSNTWPIFRSTDDGQTWEGPIYHRKEDMSSGMTGSGAPAWSFFWPAAAPSSITFDPDDPGKAWLSDAFLVWETDDAWADTIEWVAVHEGLEDTVAVDLAVSPADDGHDTELLGAFADFRGLRWELGETMPVNRLGNREQGITGSDMCALAVSEQHPATWYGSVNQHWIGPSSLMRSDDGGQTWAKVTNPIPDEENHGGAKVAVSATNPDVVVYVPGLEMTARYSHDGGETWSDVSGMAGVSKSRRNFNFDDLVVADAVDGDTFYVFSPISGDFYTSRDGGANWDKSSADLPVRGGPGGGDHNPVQLAAKPNAAGVVWVCTGTRGVFRSNDYGHTFQQIDLFTGGNTTGVAYGAPDPGTDQPTLYVLNYTDATDGLTLFRSLDDGATYEQVSDVEVATTHVINMAASRREFGTIYLSSNGRGIVVGRAKP